MSFASKRGLITNKNKTNAMRNILAVFFLGFSTLVIAQDGYTLSDNSTLTIDGTSTLHDWTVTANSIEGQVSRDGESINAIDFTVAVVDILSGRAAAMDNKTHDALKYGEHSKVLFSAKDIDAKIGKNQTIAGKMTIAGVEKTVNVPVNITENNGVLQITGSQKIILSEYGMEPPTAMFGSIVVGDDVTVNFDLNFTK